MLRLLIVAAALLAPRTAAAGERMIDLFRQGYQLVATEPYLSFEGCRYGIGSLRAARAIDVPLPTWLCPTVNKTKGRDWE